MNLPEKHAQKNGGHALESPAASPGGNAGRVIFDRTWHANVVGLPVSVSLQLISDAVGFHLNLSARAAGAAFYQSIPVNGNQSVSLPLGFVGSLLFEVSNWVASDNRLEFDLKLQVVPPIVFIPPVTIARQHIDVQIPTTGGASGGTMPVTVADYLALAQLHASGGGPFAPHSYMPGSVPPSPLGMVKSQPHALRPLRPLQPITHALGGSPALSAAGRPDDQPYLLAAGGEVLVEFDRGTFGWGPNWSENRTIKTAAIPYGGKRGETVRLGPQRGAGTVGWIGWHSPQENVGDFDVHIGNNFFGGWGEIDWVLYGTYSLPNPFPGQ